MAIKYKWLAGQLREIIKHSLKNGMDRLPTEAEICRKYHVSRQTVRQSLDVLENEGLIHRIQGSGTFITGLLPESEKNIIALLIYSETEYIYPSLIADIRNTLYQNGFLLEVYVTNNDTQIERQILSTLMETPPRGIIVEGCKSALPNPNTDLYTLLSSKGTQFVFLHNFYSNFENITYIKDDNYGGSYSLVRHFVELGHKKIGGIFHSEDRQGVERYHGFMDAMRDCHLPVHDSQIAWFRSKEYARLELQQDTQFIQSLLPELLANCSALIIYNDELAYWFIKELYPTHQTSFERIAIASFDNTYLSTTDHLSLTTLAHKPHMIGESVAHMIIEKIKGLPVSSVEVPWELFQKESSRKNQ